MTTDEPERSNLIVLGRNIGTYTDWDSGDTPEGFQVYDFKPIDALVDYLPSNRYVFINYGNGMFEYHNDGGDIDTSIDMIKIASMIQRDDAETVTFTQPKEWGTITGSAPIAEPWPDITAADVRKAHGWATESDPILDAIEAAGMKAAFVIPAREPAVEPFDFSKLPRPGDANYKPRGYDATNPAFDGDRRGERKIIGYAKTEPPGPWTGGTTSYHERGPISDDDEDIQSLMDRDRE